MPDNKGWRKKKQSKELAPLRIHSEESTAPGDSVEKRRPQHGWRRTISASRPQTPVNEAPGISMSRDTEDAVSERSESTPRREAKPKLARYTSLFASLKEASKGPEFLEPWSEDASPVFEPYVDPLYAMQSVRSHMNNSPSKPIPQSFNNALYRLFEDYGKVREEKERLENLIQEMIADWFALEKQWSAREVKYKDEIRRLELLIARGSSGMKGLMNARQGSLIERRSKQRKAASADRLDLIYRTVSPDQLDGDIKARSQEVLLRRPISPSETMTALSRQFAGNGAAFLVGTPPLESRTSTLSRKYRSEVDLTRLSEAQPPPRLSLAISPAIGTVSHEIMETSSNEGSLPSSEPVESPIECDAIVALRQLGALVAKRRGLNVESFLEAFMGLLSLAQTANKKSDPLEQETAQERKKDIDKTVVVANDIDCTTSRPSLRRYRTSPYLTETSQPRRHFSFEVGDDQIELLSAELMSHSTHRPESPRGYGSSFTAARVRRSTLQTSSLTSTPSSQNLNTDVTRPSKIPSPVQTLGRLRRENSSSSARSSTMEMARSRRDSRASIVSALKHTSRSRSGSHHTARTAIHGKSTGSSLSDTLGHVQDLAVVAAKVANSRATIHADGSPIRHVGRSNNQPLVSDRPKATNEDQLD